MRVELADLKVEGFEKALLLSWWHGILNDDTHTPQLDPKDLSYVPAELGTICSIEEWPVGSEKKLVAQGIATLHHSEPAFVKETGRKVSLKYALENGKFPRKVRARFWEVYNNRKGTAGHGSVAVPLAEAPQVRPTPAFVPCF